MDQDQDEDDDRLQQDEDVRSAIAITRMVDDLEKAHPRRTRRIETQLLWILARRAGYSGYGPELLQVVRSAIQQGEDDRREEEARAAEAADPAMPRPTTDCVGHA
ncbi:hypothetical protein [uncultured Alsobacter sp.]|uniref:hypothetical protein n=1 Tax=uncultured Alsobacter sp. TaxID=1748258 RepID=UPI0025F8285C|nr:hypothetical protein [uncultured Alsobacter sp.]